MSRRAHTAYRCGQIEGIILITALAGRNTEPPLMYCDLRLYSVDYQRREGVNAFCAVFVAAQPVRPKEQGVSVYRYRVACATHTQHRVG